MLILLTDIEVILRHLSECRYDNDKDDNCRDDYHGEDNDRRVIFPINSTLDRICPLASGGQWGHASGMLPFGLRQWVGDEYDVVTSMMW